MPRATQDTETQAHRFAYGALTLCGPPFQDGSARMRMCVLRSYYPRRAQARGGFGLFPGRSPLLGESLLFSLPAGTKMFQFPAFAPHSSVVTAIRAAGLSHSEIRGSKAICAYPRLIAAYHVLHRLREPRHPPYALRHFRLTPHISKRYGGSSYFQLFRSLSRISTEGGSQMTHALFVRWRVRRLLQSCLSQHVKDRFRIFGVGTPPPPAVAGGLASPILHRSVENNGFEPLTPCLQSRCSSQLS